MKPDKHTTIAIVGATGFLGWHLIRRLLNETPHSITAISSSGERPNGIHANPRLKVIAASVFDEAAMEDALERASIAYYFVHMMGQKNPDFYAQEAIAAERFSSACKTAGVERIIFMGGLGDDREQLSDHLLSRHNTGMILREHAPLVLEFRASMIIGNGSLAYDIIRNLVRKLPVIVLPKWSISMTQPIALDDALEYLEQAIDVELPHSEIIEIGGSEVVSYAGLYKRYGEWAKTPRPAFRMTLIPDWLGGTWLNVFTPRRHARVGKIMVHSLMNSMVVRRPEKALKYFPSIKPRGLEAAFEDTVRHPMHDSTDPA